MKINKTEQLITYCASLVFVLKIIMRYNQTNLINLMAVGYDLLKRI